MTYTMPTCDAVNDLLEMYEGKDGELLVRRFLTEAENCIAGAKKGPGQFLWGIYGDEEKEGAKELVEELPEYGKIWYGFAEQFVGLEGKYGRDIDLEEICKEFPHVRGIL